MLDIGFVSGIEERVRGLEIESRPFKIVIGLRSLSVGLRVSDLLRRGDFHRWNLPYRHSGMVGVFGESEFTDGSVVVGSFGILGFGGI